MVPSVPSSHVGWCAIVNPELHVKSQLSPFEIARVVPSQVVPSCPLIGADTAETSQLLGVHLSVSVEKEPGTKPDAHLAARQLFVSVPLHEEHALTDGSEENALQHPVNKEKAVPSHVMTGYPVNPLAHERRSPLTVVDERTTSYPMIPAGNSLASGAHSRSHRLGLSTQLP